MKLPHSKAIKWNYLALGDSITHGYDALHPNQSYVNLLARTALWL